MTRIQLYPFSYFDIRTRKWWRARYVCELEAIAQRYAAFKVTGAPEIREVPDDPHTLTAGHLARP